MVDLIEKEEEQQQQLLLDREEQERRLLEEEETKKKKTEDVLKRASWNKPEWAAGSEKDNKSGNLYDIDPALKHLPENGANGLNFSISDVNDKAQIARIIAVVRECSPDNAEIGVRINPNGEPEVYAEGKNFDPEDFRKKYAALVGGNLPSAKSSSVSATDYQNAKTSLSPEQQKDFIDNAAIAQNKVSNLDRGLNTIEEISAALDKETVKDTLSKVGAKPIVNDELVATAASKLPKELQKISI